MNSDSEKLQGNDRLRQEALKRLLGPGSVFLHGRAWERRQTHSELSLSKEKSGNQSSVGWMSDITENGQDFQMVMLKI